MKNKEIKLTPRQEWLYDYLKRSFLMNPNQYIEQITIINALAFDIKEGIYKHDDRYFYNTNPKCHDHCSAIWSDVKAINNSYKKDKIICVKDLTYKIAKDRAEALEFANKLKKDALKKLERHWRIIDKIRRDGQGKTVSNDNVAIDEKSRAREYYETFIKTDIESMVSDSEKTEE
jgi:hypothetical protein